VTHCPPISRAQVISQDPDNEAVYVTLLSGYGGQGAVVSVQVLTHGPRDAVVGHFPALPTPGTGGVVVFPSGDDRSGIWLGAISTQLTDASAHAPGNGGADYAAHYGGGYSYRSENGDLTEAFPDGTILQVGAAPAALTRHTVDETQQRQRTAFTAALRRPQTPSAFPVALVHPTGASGTVSAAGAWSVVAASGQAITLSAGGVTLTFDGSGNLAVSGDTTVSVTSSSAITLHAPAISAGNGGTTQGVQLADNSISTIFKAQ